MNNLQQLETFKNSPFREPEAKFWWSEHLKELRTYPKYIQNLLLADENLQNIYNIHRNRSSISISPYLTYVCLNQQLLRFHFHIVESLKAKSATQNRLNEYYDLFVELISISHLIRHLPWLLNSRWPTNSEYEDFNSIVIYALNIISATINRYIYVK